MLFAKKIACHYLAADGGCFCSAVPGILNDARNRNLRIIKWRKTDKPGVVFAVGVLRGPGFPSHDNAGDTCKRTRAKGAFNASTHSFAYESHDFWRNSDISEIVCNFFDPVRCLVPDIVDDSRLVQDPPVREYCSVLRHLQGRHTQFPLPNTQIDNEALCPASFTVNLVIVGSGGYQTCDFFINIDMGLLSKPESLGIVVPTIETDLQNELIEKCVARLRYCLHNVHRAVHVGTFVEPVPESKSSRARHTPVLVDDPILQSCCGENHLER
jgi:hypothetical protein